MTQSQKTHSPSALILTLGMCGVLLPSVKAFSQNLTTHSSIRLDAEFVCRFQLIPKTSSCPHLNHLRLRFEGNISDNLSYILAWDPSQVVKPTWRDSYEVFGQRLPTRQSWFDYYAIRWRPLRLLELSVEDWTATTLLPDASGLSFAQALQDSGWKQTAVRLSYIGQGRLQSSWSLIAGLGEGERLSSRDASHYWGLIGRREFLPAIEAQLGWSIDKDSLNPEQFSWLDRSLRSSASQGFQTERRALSLLLNGKHALAQGLRLAVGWQENKLRSPSQSPSSSGALSSDGPFDPTEFIPHVLQSSGSVTKRTMAFSGSYLMLAEYIAAFHWQDLQVSLENEDRSFKTCETMDNTGQCLNPSSSVRKLGIAQRSFGFGRIDDDGWSLLLESVWISYNNLFELYHFAPNIDRRQRALHLAQLNLRWTW